MKNKCVYLHKTKDGVVFYVGSGSIQRAFRKTGRNPEWFSYSKLGFDVEIIYYNLTKVEAIDLEKQTISKLNPPANKVNPSHVKDLNLLIDSFSKYFTIVGTGSGLVWKIKSKNNKIQEGSIAGSLGKNGRWQVKLGKKLYLCHRIVYLLAHGSIDNSMIIDHKNGNPSDNRIENLRQVSNSFNSINRIRHVDDDMFNIQYYKGKQEYFVVRWQESDSRKSKYFGVTKKQSIEKAKKSAIEFRDKLLIEGKLILRITNGAN